MGAFKDIHLIFKRLGKCVYRSNKTKCVFFILHDVVDMDIFFYLSIRAMPEIKCQQATEYLHDVKENLSHKVNEDTICCCVCFCVSC